MLEAATAAVQMLLLMTKRSCLSLTLEQLVAEELLKRTTRDNEREGKLPRNASIRVLARVKLLKCKSERAS